MSRRTRAVMLFALLMGFWLLLSGRFDPLLLSLGVASSLLVTWLALPIFHAALGEPEDTPRIHLVQLVLYLFWLVSRIPAAAVVIARVVLDPRLPPRPGVFRFHTTLPNPSARMLLATSITVVPGTITVAAGEDGWFVVHAFSPDAAADLAEAAMQNRIAAIFRSEPEPKPRLIWEPVHDEMPEEPT